MDQAVTDNFQHFHKQVKEIIPPSRLITDPLRTLVYGTDASFYRLTPKIVIDVIDENEVVAVITIANHQGIAITFRAAGTSLSGQSITDSVLVRLAPDCWRGYKVKDGGNLVTLQPGVIGASANRYLLPYRRKIGPDPSSINSAKIGGIAANNASGNCCGIAQNSYQTLKNIRLVLADGTILDTGNKDSVARFKSTHQEFLDEVSNFAQQTCSNTELKQRIRHKYRIKNTMGYSLNALVDFNDPVEIIAHLMIGSEGTLGFISEITYETVEEHLFKASALVIFETIESACKAVALLKSQDVSAVELMDRRAIKSVQNEPGMPKILSKLSSTASALLIETRAANESELKIQITTIQNQLDDTRTVFPVSFTTVADEYNSLWKIRKGLFPAVGAVRETGTTVIIEDVAFDVSRLAQATLDLQALFTKYAYDEAIIFGHALEGNLHFVFTQDFSTAMEVERYRLFMDDVCKMVVHKYDGSLKAEHSTGRNMAPFLEMQWGTDAYELMKKIKQLFDPKNILNPGVILNENAQSHVMNLKPLYPVDPLIDKCIECGFCEPMCPSRALSLTPRQRITGLREINRLKDLTELDQSSVLATLFQYQGVDTCAGDGLCSVQCPVGIDTGKMMKSIRGSRAGKLTNKTANAIVNHYGMIEKASRVSLKSANLIHDLIGTSVMNAVCRSFRKLSGNKIPLWNKYMPKAASSIKHKTLSGNPDKVVYFASCASRMMGAARGDTHDESLHVVTTRVLEKAGFDVIVPENIAGQCCGMPFESKGLNAQARTMLGSLEKILLQASSSGKYPIVFDTSPCSFRTRNNSSLKFYDITEFLYEHVLDKLEINQQDKTVALHATCSTTKMKLEEKLLQIAQRCASNVIIPDGVSCCGWAGDKGFTTPELNASATRLLKSSLPDDCREGYSTSRTCEIGLSVHSDRYYKSIVYLLDDCSDSIMSG